MITLAREDINQLKSAGNFYRDYSELSLSQYKEID